MGRGWKGEKGGGGRCEGKREKRGTGEKVAIDYVCDRLWIGWKSEANKLRDWSWKCIRRGSQGLRNLLGLLKDKHNWLDL